MSSQPPSTPSQGLALLNGRYRLLALIASGGMATVYKAQDTLLNRLVAVKTLRDRFAQDPQFVQRFHEEAQAAANLNHPNIITIFDVGRDVVSGVERHYIVMEYVEGHDLKHLIRERVIGATGAGAAPAVQAFGIDETVNIARQICEGVGYAHRRGLVHCDLKPQNVIITPDGKAKVADFGIARAYTAMVAERADVVWGTPQYYAPEQATGAVPTPASDVYSIGIMLYEMLSGRLPFEARDPQELARLHLNVEPTALHLLNPNVPLQLEAIVRRTLSKDPAQRYRDADQLARVLVAYLQQGEEQTLNQPTYTGRTSPAQPPAPSSPQSQRAAAPRAPLSRTQPPAQPSGRAPGQSQPRPGAGQTFGSNVNPSGRTSPAQTGATVPGAPGAVGAAAATDSPARAEQGTDLLVWLLGAVAVLCVLGLIPLYAFVFRAYTTPAPTPAPRRTPGAIFTPTIIISGTGETLILPSFIGLSLDEASQGVSLLGLAAPAIETFPDPLVQQPKVFDQRPAPGEQVPKSISVTFAVSVPTQAQPVPVDLVGRLLDESLSQTLRTVGWNVVVSESIAFQPEGIILNTDPPGGQQLAVSGTLTLTVSTGGRVPLEVNMSPVMLDWARFSRDEFVPGQTIQFSIHWRAVAPVNKGYKVGWYLLSADGNAMIAQGEDREPRDNGNPAPTNAWGPDTVVLDTYALVVPNGLSPGTYQVGVSLYDDQGRLHVLDVGKADTRGDLVLLRAVQVQ